MGQENRSDSLVFGELVLQQSHVVGGDEPGLQRAGQLLGQHVLPSLLDHRQFVPFPHRQLVVAAGLEVEERRVQLHLPLLGRRDADVAGHGADLGRLSRRVGNDMVVIRDVWVAEFWPDPVPEPAATRHTRATAVLHPGSLRSAAAAAAAGSTGREKRSGASRLSQSAENGLVKPESRSRSLLRFRLLSAAVDKNITQRQQEWSR